MIAQSAWGKGNSSNDFTANFVQLGSNLQLAGPRIGRKPMINDEQINTKNLGIIIIKHLNYVRSPQLALRAPSGRTVNAFKIISFN